MYSSGLPINFYIDNPSENRAELESRLSENQKENVFILPKTENYFRGYGLHFAIKSLGSEVAKSTINEVSLYPLPIYFLKGLALVNPNISSSMDEGNSKKPLPFQKINDSLYLVNKAPSYNAYVVLSQAFDSGWRLYAIKDSNWLKVHLPFLFGEELKEHVLVNNWANGWIVEELKIKNEKLKIVVIFWPQYLEYLGFVFLGLGLVWIVKYR